MRHVFLARVPFADVLDAAVVKAVLAAGGCMQVECDENAELRGPVERAVQHVDAAFDERMRVCAVLAVIRIRRAEDPVPDRDAHRVDADACKPRKILARDEALPVGTQPRRRLPAQLRAIGGLISRREPIEQARFHPLFQQQPATEIDASEVDRGGRRDSIRHSGFSQSHRRGFQTLQVPPMDRNLLLGER